MRCPRCQHENPSGQKFCGECGTPLAGASQARPHADLKDENERLRRPLTEALEQQTATSEILRVIASSRTDIQPVLEAMAKAPPGCAGRRMPRFSGWKGTSCVSSGTTAARSLAIGDTFPSTWRRRGRGGGRPADDPRRGHRSRGRRITPCPARMRGAGHRAMLTLRCCARARPWASSASDRTEVHPFSDKQIALLRRSPTRRSSPSRTSPIQELEARNRSDRGARAANGHGGDPAGHRELADGSPAGHGSNRRERRSTL